MKLAVNHIFQTIQGEATNAGTPATFVRLQGCTVGCPWCDTKETWSVDDQLRAPGLPNKAGLEVWAGLDHWEILEEISRLIKADAPGSDLVVITGGEPLEQDIRPLCRTLEVHRYRVQIETSGTRPIDLPSSVWVTVSPKLGMKGGLALEETAISRANEIKMPVGRASDIQALRTLLMAHAPNLPNDRIFLQPLSQSPKATELCIEAAGRYGWRVSLQTHKFIGID